MLVDACSYRNHFAGVFEVGIMTESRQLRYHGDIQKTYHRCTVGQNRVQRLPVALQFGEGSGVSKVGP